MNEDRLASQSDIRIARLSALDVRSDSDSFRDFERFASQSEDMYSGIQSWLKGRVRPGILRGERSAYVAYADGKPVGTAILKLAADAKFCHLRIAEERQERHLGELFFALMALDLRGNAENVHFTLPESVWHRREAFFRSFGFEDARPFGFQYRLFDTELTCRAPFSDVWRRTADKLPKLWKVFSVGGYSLAPSLVLGIRHEHGERIIRGEKTVEIRRRFDPRWQGTRVVLCAGRPSGALLGEARLSRVTSGTASEIWSAFGDRVGCTYGEFANYVLGKDRIMALELDEITPYICPIPLNQLSYLTQRDLRVPQSYTLVSGHSDWESALSLAALMHGSLRTRASLQKDLP